MTDGKICPRCGGKNILVRLHIFRSEQSLEEAIRAKRVFDPPWICSDCQHRWGIRDDYE
jgi:hypothetical protein